MAHKWKCSGSYTEKMGAHWVELRIVCLFSGDVEELSVIGGRLIISGCVLYLIGNNLVAHWQHKIPMSQWVWGSNASFLIQEPLYITMYIVQYMYSILDMYCTMFLNLRKEKKNPAINQLRNFYIDEFHQCTVR